LEHWCYDFAVSLFVLVLASFVVVLCVHLVHYEATIIWSRVLSEFSESTIKLVAFISGGLGAILGQTCLSETIGVLDYFVPSFACLIFFFYGLMSILFLFKFKDTRLFAVLALVDVLRFSVLLLW
jgi:hypothetical protein